MYYGALEVWVLLFPNSLGLPSGYLGPGDLSHLSISKNASPEMLLSDPEWLGRPSQEPWQALRYRCLRHLSRLRRPVPLIQTTKEAQEKSSTGPARHTFADLIFIRVWDSRLCLR